MKKNAGALGLLLLLLLIFGCGGHSSDSMKNTLRVALIDNPTNLDPRTYSDVVSYKVIEQVYDFLVRMDSTGLPRPDLAESWEMPSDTVFIFHLRKNVFFHDGVPLTAKDVAFTFRSMQNPELRAPLRKSLEVIRDISVPDSFTVRFSLRYPHAAFLANLEVGIVPEHAVRAGIDLQRHPLGSGPFQFVRWDVDQRVVLKKNDHYWKGAPRVAFIQMEILPEATTRVLALENGEIDFLMNNFPQSYLPRLEKNPALKILKKSGSNYVYLGMNLRNKYLKNKKVRHALAHAINIPEIIRTLMGGIPRPAKSLLNPRHWAYNPHLKSYEFNPDSARRLLDEAGFPDPDGDGPRYRFKLSYKCTDKLQSRQKAQVIQQYLKEVGIGVNIQSFEWGTFFDDIQNGRFDLYSLTWVGIYEPDIYDRIFNSRSIGKGANRGGYVNPKVDRLLEAAQKTFDIAKRRQYYWRIQEILQDNLPYISLWYETNVAVMNRRVSGFLMYPAGEWRSFRRVRLLP